MSIHSIKRAQCHLAWDNSIPPVIRIKSGEEVEFDCLDASNGQITASSTVEVLNHFILSESDQVNGPVYITDASAGDTLQVDVLSIKTANWGWSALLKGFGILSDEYPDVFLKIWRIESDEDGPCAWFDAEKTIRIPVRPFAGEMGVAPEAKGAFSTIPPYITGGNLDTKHLTVGSTLYLPIKVPGALFSIGDGHAAQGDGEVCGTAIETPMQVKVRLTVLKNKPYVSAPQYSTTTPASAGNAEYYVTTGVNEDIREATRSAVRNMVTFLSAEKGLGRENAYILCSVAADLRLHEVVDMPNYVVGLMLPKSIFVK